MSATLGWRKAFDQDLWVRPVGSFLLKVRPAWAKGEYTWSIEPGTLVASMLSHRSVEAAQLAAEEGLRVILRNALSLLEQR